MPQILFSLRPARSLHRVWEQCVTLFALISLVVEAEEAFSQSATRHSLFRELCCSCIIFRLRRSPAACDAVTDPQNADDKVYA